MIIALVTKQVKEGLVPCYHGGKEEIDGEDI